MLDYLKQVTHKSKITDIIDSNYDEDPATRSIDNSAEGSEKMSFSIANELEKLSKLKNENVISDEFQMMKNKLFKKMND